MISFSFSLAAWAAFAQIAGSEAVQPCSASHGPEVGVGILCDRARIALDERELSVAADLAETASELAPSYPGTWILRAEVAQGSRLLNEARDHYETAMGLQPQSAGLLMAIGDFEAEEGNVRGAAVLYDRAAKIDPDFPGLRERIEAIPNGPEANEI
ncbi:MAG: hypothetical protein AAF788_04660 [Pseudomonadota bacterium]